VYRWGEPELGLAIGVRYMDVNSCLFAGEEEQAELAVTKGAKG